MKKPKHLFEIIIISLIIICVFIIGYTYNRSSISSVESKLELVLSKIQGFFYGIGDGIKSSIDNVVNFSNIKNENEMLKKENYELKKQVEQGKSYAIENERLRKAFELEQNNDLYTLKGCNIISIGSIGSYADQIIIDKGSKDGIKKEMVIVDYINELVGKVVSTTEDVAKVQLLTNENIRVSASVNSPDNESGIANGYRDNLNRAICKFTIPIGVDVNIGDNIVTSGVGNIYPKGISIGKITSVEEDKVKLQKVCDVKPFVDIGNLKEVFVVIPSDKLNVEY